MCTYRRTCTHTPPHSQHTQHAVMVCHRHTIARGSSWPCWHAIFQACTRERAGLVVMANTTRPGQRHTALSNTTLHALSNTTMPCPTPQTPCRPVSHTLSMPPRHCRHCTKPLKCLHSPKTAQRLPYSLHNTSKHNGSPTASTTPPAAPLQCLSTVCDTELWP